MPRSFPRCVIAARMGVVAVATAACGQTAPAPYGEVFVAVDTDVPVGAGSVASVLRVDLYRDDGTWFQSRTLSETDPAGDWPVSFSVYGTDPQNDSRVVARLRIYPANVERDYLGEQFAARPSYTPPVVAMTGAAVCNDVPALVLGQPLTLRRGPLVVDSLVATGECSQSQVGSGAVAATLTVTQADTYHIEVIQAVPGFTDTALLVRTACADPSTQIACNDDISATDLLSVLELPLAVGTYSVHVLGVTKAASNTDYQGPADVTLRATVASQWSVAPAAASQASSAPRLILDGIDATPPTEPLPSVTIDRLALLHIRPGIRSTAHVVLRGNCAGTMPRLGATAPYQTFVVAEAVTCIDTENTRVPLADEPLLPGVVPVSALPDPRLQFVDGLGCPAASSAPLPATICVPGGAMILGEVDLSGRGPEDAVPPRLVKLTPFWMDVNEVTVGEWRSAATSGGFVQPTVPDINDGPLPGSPPAESFPALCSYSTQSLGREDFAVTCVTQESARAFCQWRGGDLPTEAQWEYAAADVAYWGGLKSAYPWEVSPAPADLCQIAVFGRDDPGSSPQLCYSAQPADPTGHGYGPLAVTARATPQGDMTHLGLIGLTGGVAEYMRDAFESYSSPCWASAPLVNPTCSEPFAPELSTRGGAWDTQGDNLRVAERNAFPADFLSTDTGFRCVYAVQ
jgi:formylglycine-generating enzyme required for sulfatase activity